MGETSIEKIDSKILQLQSLETEFDLVMTQYKQAYLDFINSVQTINGNNYGNNRQFTSLQGRRFWGTAGIKDVTVNSEDECSAMCAQDAKCTGATFNSSTGYCWLRSGNGSVTVSTNNNEFALMPSVSQNTNNLQMLNDKLINLNLQIMDTLNEIEPVAFDETERKNEKKAFMETTNGNLLSEREKIEKLLDQYNDLTQQYNVNSIYVRQTNAMYMLWSFISISLIIIIIKLLLTPEAKTSENMVFLIKLLMFFILIFIITKLNHPSAFAIFGLIVILVIFKIMNQTGSGSKSGYGSGSGSGSGYGSNSYSQKSYY